MPGGIKFREVDEHGEVTWNGNTLSATAKVHELYLSDKETGATSALNAALRTLLEQDSLPDNPSFLIATVVSAFNDKSPAWREADAPLLQELDASSPVVYDPGRQVCRLAGSNCAWGLPHVLRTVYTEGIKALHHVLVHNLHNSFCSASAPFQAQQDGAIVRIMCSLHGSCVSYNPARQVFPELRLQADVLVSGIDTEQSIDTFASIILRDSRDMQLLPLNALVAVRTVMPVRTDADAVQRGVNATTMMTRDQIEADTATFFTMVKKAVISSMVRHAVMLLITFPGGNPSRTTPHLT